MSRILMWFMFIPVAFGADPGTSYNWKAAPQAVEVPQRELDIVLSAPLPQHWALTVVPARGESTQAAKISAASAVLDGTLIERLDNLDLRRLDLKPGEVHIQGIPNEPGLAVCVTVPAGTHVRVLRDDVLIRSSSAGLVIQDGRAAAGSPRLCASVPLLQQAILAR